MNEQLFVTIAVGPVLSLAVVIAGCVVQSISLRACVADFKSYTRELLNEQGHAPGFLGEITALRAEMAENHRELMARFAKVGRRFDCLEEMLRR